MTDLAEPALSKATAADADRTILDAIDATLYLIGKLYGVDAAEEVARLIEYDRAYRANREALGHHAGVHRAAS
ncbi:hypothetical protein ACIKTA_08100 [Hansschlegelia beijingensis]